MSHELYMQRCLDLALLGKGKVSPNPMVGCVIVKNEQIIAEGYHESFGGPHAEVNAINQLADKNACIGATLFVNLEPCSHHGKTPPCSDLLVQMQIKQVVVAMQDPNPLVAGKGIEKLKKAGIDVTVGVLASKAEELNRTFIHAHTQKRPYYMLKWAQTLNGKMGKKQYSANESKSISSADAKIIAHKWRTEIDALLVGAHTVITDQPQLNNRLWFGKHPVVVILDPQLKANPNNFRFDPQTKILVVNSLKHEVEGQLHYCKIDFSQWPSQLNTLLFDHQLHAVMVEGGAFTLNQFIEANLWDECRVFVANHNKDWDISAPEIPGHISQQYTLQHDQLIITRPAF